MRWKKTLRISPDIFLHLPWKNTQRYNIKKTTLERLYKFISSYLSSITINTVKVQDIPFLVLLSHNQKNITFDLPFVSVRLSKSNQSSV